MQPEAPRVEIVSATRRDAPDFWRQAALGLSLKRLEHEQRVQAHISYSNRCGLPEIYNHRIDASAPEDDPDAILVFVHDDVWLEDYYLPQRLDEALQQFDIVGVAGNKRRKPFQPGWCFAQHQVVDAPQHLSGAVAHGMEPLALITPYGPAPAACKLLDGVLLAARRSVLRAHQLRFDKRFDFHIYDMDFCRQAEQKQLRIGTWPICLTHQSAGNFFASASWRQAYEKYLDKWGN